MIYKKIPLDPTDEGAFLEVCVADKIKGLTRDALLVIPGGGYGGVCHDREGEPIGMAFVPYGFNYFVLHYSVKEKGIFPKQLIQASKAIKHIRDNAEEYNINPDRVFAVGFSAGGHLAGSLGILWDNEQVYKEIDMEYGYNKPNGVMLIYPVVSGIEDFGHKGSFYNLLNSENPSDEALYATSLEKHVCEKSSPAFILHTVNDQVVDVRNSLALASAYTEAGVTYELHIYPDGPHGVALANHITMTDCKGWVDASIAKWIENAVHWTKKLQEMQ